MLIFANLVQLQIYQIMVVAGEIIAPMTLKILLSFANVLLILSASQCICNGDHGSGICYVYISHWGHLYDGQMYDYKLKPFVWLFSLILKPLRRHWNGRTFLVGVFGSFIYLSSSRLLWTLALRITLPIMIQVSVYNAATFTVLNQRVYLIGMLVLQKAMRGIITLLNLYKSSNPTIQIGRFSCLKSKACSY